MNRFLLLVPFLLIAFVSPGQRKKTDTPQQADSPIAAKVKGSKRFDGFFTFYHDEKQDKIYLELQSFNAEFLYVNSLSAGIGSNDIGLDRGQLGGERVVHFERRGPKVLLIEPNYRYRAITDNKDEKRAVEEAFASSVLFGFKVEAEQDGAVLIDATDFFMLDAHNVSEALRSANQGNYTLDKSKSALYPERIRNFPDNSEFEAILTFSGTPSGQFIRSVTPTPSLVTVRQHHSFVRLPDSDYQPRLFDPRAGYFAMSYYDYATPIEEPIAKRFITRHRLKKKNPEAEVSDPVEPIIYYLDRGTPEPVRSALLDGARWWNQAFEAAGYRNAFRVEMMPEGADPMDVRYNVIQWVHRSTRGWSYGSSVTDPRTGEIIKGHVSLGSLRVRQDFLIAEGLLAPYEDDKPVSKEMEIMALARLRQLSAHEVGHTLGLAHSYASSTESLASVMDYPHPMVNLTNGKISLDGSYDDKIGAWDKVAIAYGYQDFRAGIDEQKALNDIIQSALKKGLSFLSDQDARPAGSSHPYAHLWDNGKEAHEELSRVLDIRAAALNRFGENNIRQGAPMAMLEEVLVPIYFFHRYQVEAAAKLLGGLNYRYALKGDGQIVTDWVPASSQRKSLDQLLRSISPTALALPEPLLKNLPPRPLGYQRSRELTKGNTDLTFDPLGAAASAADLVVSLIVHPARANRLAEHNSRNAELPSLTNVVDQIIAQTLDAKRLDGYPGALQMTVNDVILQNLFKLASSESASAVVKAIVELKLQEIKSLMMAKAKLPSPEVWKAHSLFSVREIDRYFDNPDAFKASFPSAAPPGQPIGQDWMEYCTGFH